MSLVTQTVKFKNTSKDTLHPTGLGLGKIAPGEEVDIPLSMTAATIKDNGSRGKSPIESQAPQLQPVDPVFAEHWSKTPQELAPVSRMVTSQGRAPVDPPGIIAARAAKAKADEARASEGKPEASGADPKAALQAKLDAKLAGK